MPPVPPHPPLDPPLQWVVAMPDKCMAISYYCNAKSMWLNIHDSGVATIEATEAAASVQILNNRLSRPEFWHP